MIGPIAGSSDSISQLKQLLEMASDPKKLAETIGHLEKVQADTHAILEEKSKVESQAEAKLKKLAADQEAFDKRAVEMAQEEKELKGQHMASQSALADLKARESNLAQALQKLSQDQAALNAQQKELGESREKFHAELDSKMTEAKAMKAEYEAKLQKLKQAIG